MCQGCWEEEGSPRDDGPAVRRAADLVVEVCRWHSTGGPLSLVVSNWNLEDEHVAYCARVVADPTEWDDEDCEEYRQAVVELSQLLVSLTQQERAAVLGLADGYWEVGQPA